MSNEEEFRSSYSALKGWLHCQKQFELERIKGAARTPAWFNIGGTVFHEWSELFDRGVEPPPIKRLFLEAVEEEERKTGIPRTDWIRGGRVSKEYPDKESEAWWLFHLPLMAQSYQAWRDSTKWVLWEPSTSVLAIELEMTTRLGGVTLKAHADRGFVLPSGELAVVDLKTGSRKPESTLQLGVYATAIQMNYGVRPKWGYYYMARQGKHIGPYDLDKYTPSRLEELYRQFRLGVENGVFIPNVGNHCKTCGVARFCFFGGGADAEAHDELANEKYNAPF